jgi:MFS family permease
MVLGSLYFTGIMIGNLLCSLLADRWGRKRMLLLS